MSLINTRIQNLRAMSNVDKNELRPSRYGALDLFLQQTTQPGSIITPELAATAEKSIGNTLQTPVFDFDGTITIGNTRPVIIVDSENISQLMTISFATYSWGFTIVPAMYMNNEFNMQADFERKFLKYLYKFAETVDGACVSALSTAKTQVYVDPLQYPTTGNVLQATWEQRDLIIGDLNPIMAANDHFGVIHLLGNGGIESSIRKQTQSGLYNAVNKQLEYSDKVLHFSSRVANAASQYGSAFAVQAASVGIMARFERESLLGTRSRTGHEWGIDTLPMVNMPVGTYYYESVGDYNAIAGAATADLTRARKEHYGFAVDLAIVTPYNSDPTTIANPIAMMQIAEEVPAP